MWKVQRTDDGDSIVMLVSGRIEAQHLGELREALYVETGDEKFALDLREVRLVDQDAITFLADREASGVHLRNCPPYIREWIARDRETESGLPARLPKVIGDAS
jgi:anti-anti-sigma regulatory factor